jgi:hypothetical protein
MSRWIAQGGVVATDDDAVSGGRRSKYTDVLTVNFNILYA